MDKNTWFTIFNYRIKHAWLKDIPINDLFIQALFPLKLYSMPPTKAADLFMYYYYGFLVFYP